MTTRTTTGSKSEPTGADETGRAAAVGQAVSDVAGTVKGAANDVAARLPEIAATTRSALDDANQQMQRGSDERLAVGSALSFGLAGGLLLSGASRLLVAAALVPAVAMALTMLDRSSRARQLAERRLQRG